MVKATPSSPAPALGLPRRCLFPHPPLFCLPMGPACGLPDSLCPPPKRPGRPDLVVASWMRREAAGERRWRLEGPGRGQVWEAVAGRVGWARAGNHRSGPVPPGLFRRTPSSFRERQQSVPCFPEFRFSQIRVKQTLGSTRTTQAGVRLGLPFCPRPEATNKGLCPSTLRLGSLFSRAPPPIPTTTTTAKGGRTKAPQETHGTSVQPSEDPIRPVSHRRCTLPKRRELCLERVGEGRWGKADAAW